MKVEDMVQQLSTLGRRRTDPLMWESILYYYGSIMLSKFRYRKEVGSTDAIRYFGIIFANSGIGKSYAMNKIEKYVDLREYSGLMLRYFNQSQTLSTRSDQPLPDPEEIIKYMPKSSTIGVEGTAEGLFQVAQSQAASMFGSLNLSSEEFTETISTSAGLLTKLKEMHDGKFQAKIIKGDNDSEMKGDIHGIICNFIGVGSRKAVTHSGEKELKRIATSGLYRRTFIIDSVQEVEKNREPDDVEKFEEYIDSLNKEERAKLNAMMDIDWFLHNSFKYSKEYIEMIEEIDDRLIEEAQNDKLNDFAQYDTGSLEMILDLSHIVAFLERDNEMQAHHIEDAYNFFKRTRQTVTDTFRTTHPYKLMYELLKKKSDMTVSEMAEYEHEIPISKVKLIDNVALLEELCYRRDEVLIKQEGKVTRFKIEALPTTNLKKLIISTCGDGKFDRAINFSQGLLAWELFPRLVTSENIDSFTCCHYEPTTQAPEGHRHKDRFIEGQNLISFDIDEGMTLEEVKNILHEYTYLIYTTKSHQKEKNGFVCDRFRILLPTKTEFYVTAEQHKNMYANLEVALEITSNDTKTRNVSRLFYTNTDAEVFLNDGKLIDVSCCIPSTDKSDKIMPVMQNIEEQQESGEMGKREAGFIKYVLMNTGPGNRNDMIHNYLRFLQDLGTSDIANKVWGLNSMLIDPLPEHEIIVMLKAHRV